MKKKVVKKIVLFMGDHARHVCPILRVIAPAQMVGIQVLQGNERIAGKFQLHLDRIAAADLVIIQRDFPVDFAAYERVVHEARDAGKQILYDIDDLLIDLPDDHPDTERYVPGRFPVLRAIAEADAVTVASETLKANLQDFNPNIHVLPNYLVDEIWGQSQGIPAGEDGPLTIGYMGGHSHRPDVDMLEPVFRRILDRYGEGIRLQFWGIEPPQGLAGDLRVGAAHLEYADYDQFSSYLAKQGGDIFIAPLKDSPFNRSKSWLKYLEYSALGIPGVFSDLEPYRDIVQHGKSGFLASTLDEWDEHLTALIEDPNLRQKIGEKAFKNVRKSYMLSDHAHRWKELYALVAANGEVEIGKVYLQNNLRLASRWQREIDGDRISKEQELISAHEEAQVFSGKIQEQQDALARIQMSFDDLTVKHEEVNNARAHFEKFAAEQSQKIEETTSQLAEARRLTQLIPDLQSQLKEKDQLLAELHVRLNDKDNLIADQQSQLQSKDSLIAAQESRLSAQVHLLADQVAALAAQETTRDQQEDYRVQLQAQNSMYQTSRFLRFVTRLRHSWVHFRMGILRRLGRLRLMPLFDPGWYLDRWPDVAQAGVDPYEHYLQWGWREGRNPGPYFDVIWYLRTYSDVLAAGVEPLGHYLRHGRWENRRPHPDLPKETFPMLQSIWLPVQHRPDSAASGWRKKASFRWKLLRMRRALRSGRITVPALFDGEWYLAQWPDVAESKIHLYLHYLMIGWQEGRDPHPNFNVRRYLENNPDVRDAGVEPFEHFYTFGWLEGRNPRPEIGTTEFMLRHRHDPYIGLASILSNDEVRLPASEVPSKPHQRAESTISEEESRWESAQGLDDAFARREALSTYEPEELVPLESPPVKLIAFYLPQFHPIPENDEFWGEGFTEWTNVAKARPLFEGHYQPRLPGNLGFYDLRVAEVMQRQAEMAKAHGIYGFCFHHYWFNGKRVLERPVDQFLEHPEIEMPFCLNWANENWTRRWDGYDEEVLLRQDHSVEDDFAFIADAMRYFKDPRYIRIENKPLFILYNPQRLPDPQATAERWRAACRKAGFDGLFLVAAQTFGFFDSGTIGFDAAVEFPPHNAFTREDITSKLAYYGNFKGFVADYRQLSENYPMDKTAYPLFKTVVPAWDNTARRGLNASVYHGSTPHAYMDWMRKAVCTTLENNPPDQRYVFLNAWNEWAEGTYLEPDQDYGYAYLNATTRALQTTHDARPKLLFIGHDAFRAGSQVVLLNVLRWLKAHARFDIRLILGRGGDLLADYQAVAPTFVLDEIQDDPQEIISERLKRFCGEDVRLIYANSGVSGWILPYIQGIDAPVLTHVHELQVSIEKFVGEEVFSLSKAVTDHFIAVSEPVKENLVQRHQIDEARIEVVHPFITDRSQEEDKKSARDLLGLKRDVPLIFGCGTLDWRKGPDLFLDTAGELLRRGHEGFHFYWIGKISDDFSDFEDEIRAKGLGNQVTYLGEKEDPQAYFAAGDIFLLPSREDPYPLVVLEAAQAGLPSVCFAEAGGIPAFIGEGDDSCGFVVPFEDVTAMADAIERLVEDPELRTQMGGRAKEKLLAQHTIDVAMPFILKVIRETAGLKPGVSVIVPTYNHATYLPERLDSILNQTYRDVEVLILDDASTDGTIDIIAGYTSRPEVTILINEENSGSTFAQWAKGIENASGEIIWIAEDDDTCEPELLEKLLVYFEDPAVQLAYAQSYAIDDAGEILFSYKGYTDDISAEKWEKSYVADAEAEVNLALAVKNTIPNASAVLFRRFDIQEWAKNWAGGILTGDWALYIRSIRGGKIAYHHEHLNFHRRHEETTIYRTRLDERRFIEYIHVQASVISLYRISPETMSRMREEAFVIWKEIFPENDDWEFDKYYHFPDQDPEITHTGQDVMTTVDLESSIYLKFRNTNDQMWYSLLQQTLQTNIIDGTVFPKFPPVEIQRKTVGRDGEKALRQAFNFYKLVNRYLEQTGNSLTENSHICDFGCGWGRITRFFLKDLPADNILGLDPWDSLIEECQRTFSQVEFRLIPLQPPYEDIEDSRFDLIFAYSVFSHLSPTITEKIFLEFGRMLKPGGLVIFTSRGKDFMMHCEAIRQREKAFNTEYEQQLAAVFTDLDSDISEYKRGNPIYYRYGSDFGPEDGSYGEAAYPPKYFTKQFGDIFRLLAHEKESLEEDLDQVTIILQRKESDSGNRLSTLTKYTMAPECQIIMLPEILEEHIGYKTDGRFVEVGAFDGWKWSNTYTLAEIGWKGIAIEPNPEQYAKLVENLTKHDVITYPIAIANYDGKASLFLAGSMSTLYEEQVDLYRELEWSRHFFPDDIKKVDVEVHSLDWVLKKEKWEPRFDLLVIDVEGGEVEVLNGFDIGYWLPTMIIVETHEESMDDLLKWKATEVRSRISVHGYTKVYSDTINSIYVKE